MKEFLVARENIRRMWPLVAPFMRKALIETNGEYDEASVLAELEDGQSQLWVGYGDDLKLRMIATTKIEVWPTLRRLRVELLAGVGLDDFLPLLPRLEAWAKEHGCTQTAASVRPGMKRRLVNKLGFKMGLQTVLRGIA